MNTEKFNNNMFSRIVEAAPNAMIMIDQSGKIVLVNLETEKLFGYTRQELLGNLVEMLIPKRFQDDHPGHRMDFFNAPKTRTMGAGRDLFGCRKDGVEVPIEIGLNPIESDEKVFVLASIIDITERKRAEERFRMVVEAAPNAMIMVDKSGVMVLANMQTESLFGYHRSELIGKQIEMLVPNRFRASHPGHRKSFFDNPQTRSMGAGRDLFGLRKDNSEVPIEIGLNPIETTDGGFVLASIIDITERKKNESLVTAREAALEASHIKSQFLASMSHELRTPLNSIIGFTGTLLMQLPGPLNGEQEKQLVMVQSSAKHLLTLINDILDLAKVESGHIEVHKENFQCLEVVAALTESLRPLAAKKGLEIIFTSSEQSIELYTDRRLLSQIIINLLSNGIKFTESGEVKIDVNYIREPQGNTVVFKVTDTGIGIKDDDRKSLFQPFVQVNSGPRRRVDGAGLGLHLSQKMAEVIGGTLDIDSEFGLGTTVTLKIKD